MAKAKTKTAPKQKNVPQQPATSAKNLTASTTVNSESENQVSDARPIRSTRGVGGRVRQMEIIGDLVAGGIEKQQEKRSRQDVGAEDMQENEMAPPPKKRTRGQVTRVNRRDPPMERPKLPVLSNPYAQSSLSRSNQHPSLVYPQAVHSPALQTPVAHAPPAPVAHAPPAPVVPPAPVAHAPLAPVAYAPPVPPPAPVAQPPAAYYPPVYPQAAHPIAAHQPAAHALPTQQPVAHPLAVQPHGQPPSQNSYQPYRHHQQQPVVPPQQKSVTVQNKSQQHLEDESEDDEEDDGNEDPAEGQEGDDVQDDEDDEDDEEDEDEENAGDRLNKNTDQNQLFLPTGDEEDNIYDLDPEGYENMPPNLEHEDDVNILEDHRKRNKANKPPNPAQLAISAAQHQSIRRWSPSIPSSVPLNEADGSNSDDSDDSEEEFRNSRARRNSKPKDDNTPGPQTLKYYPPSLRRVIIQGKLKFRLYLVEENPFYFANDDNDLQIPSNILAQAIANATSENIKLDSRYPVTRNMIRILAKETSTYRGRAKDICLPLVNLYYKDIITTKNIHPNQQGMYNDIAEQVEEALKNCKFLQNPEKDENGKTDNLGHPALKEAVLQFIYGKGTSGANNKSMAKYFPEHFRKAVPVPSVLLMATALIFVIQMYSTGMFYKKAKFDAEVYVTHYQALQALVEQLMGNPYHRRRFEQKLHDWAQEGMTYVDDKSSNKPKLVYTAVID